MVVTALSSAVAHTYPASCEKRCHKYKNQRLFIDDLEQNVKKNRFIYMSPPTCIFHKYSTADIIKVRINELMIYRKLIVYIGMNSGREIGMCHSSFKRNSAFLV